MLKRVGSRTLLNCGIQFCLQDTIRSDFLPVLCRTAVSGALPLAAPSVVRTLHVTASCWKVRKTEKKKPVGERIGLKSVDNLEMRDAVKLMNNVEKILEEELAKHFSLQLDVRQYEELMVKLDSGEELPMDRLGRVSLKNPQLVMIDFTENPTAIKAAKLALQMSTLEVNPQHEGSTLFIQVQRMTRERREQLASSAKTKLYHEFKQALNEIYSKLDKKLEANLKSEDEIKRTRTAVLLYKRELEAKGMEKIEAGIAGLMKEVA